MFVKVQSREEVYEQCGREDRVAMIYIKPNTPSFVQYGEYIVGVALYTQHEREELEHNLHATPPVHTQGRVRIRDTVSQISDASRQELMTEGLLIEHISDLDGYGLTNTNTFASDADRTSRDMVIPVRMMPKGRDWDWIYGFTKKRIAEGIGIPPEETIRYYALQYYYDQEEALEENREHIFSGDVMREEVEHELLYIKCIRKEASAEDLQRLGQLHHERSMRRFKLMHEHLAKAGTSFEKLLEKDRDMLGELCYRVERFGEHHLNVMGKIPIYLNLDRYLHIFLRHVRDFEVSHQFAAKDKFQWEEEEVLRVITRVVQAVDKEAQAFWEKNPGQRFSRFGPKSVYFEGDYYTVQIEADGRLSTLYKNKKDLPRVSDRSGTPEAGNPAEEYSGERDPEALRGDTPKKNTAQ